MKREVAGDKEGCTSKGEKGYWEFEYESAQ